MPKLIIDLNKLEDGQPHWLTGNVNGQGAAARARLAEHRVKLTERIRRESRERAREAARKRKAARVLGQKYNEKEIQ